MKAFFISIWMLIFIALAPEGYAKPRIIKGTVFTNDGKKARGVLVTADKSRDRYYTSFDGSYEIKAKSNSKWLNFRIAGIDEKMNLKGIERDYIDFKQGTPEMNSDAAQKVQTEKTR